MREFFVAWEDAEAQRATNEKLGITGPGAHISDDFWLDYYNFVVTGDPAVSLDLVLKLCAAAPDDDALCWVGVFFVEPLLDLHWRKIGDRFHDAATRKRSVRKALSCASLTLKPAKRGGIELERRLRVAVEDDPTTRRGR